MSQPSSKYKITIMCALAAFVSVFFVYQSNAQTVIDPQIFVQQSGTSPAGGDPNILTDTGSFVVGVAGSDVLQNPLLVIVAVYDGSGTPTISYSGCATPSACPAATIGTYALTGNSNISFTSNLQGTNTAYDALGLNAGGSMSYGNMSGGDTSIGLAAPTSFSLYAFALPTGLVGGSPITIDESGAAAGSYIFGYDCSATQDITIACTSEGAIGQTPFTNPGLISTVPEPTSMLLFGSGLVALGVKLRRRKSGTPVTT